MPSHNPDPRIRLPIPGEHIVDGQRFFEKKIKQKTSDALHFTTALGVWNETIFVEYRFYYKCWCAGLRPPTICAKVFLAYNA
jgi:hypothetical protein